MRKRPVTRPFAAYVRRILLAVGFVAVSALCASAQRHYKPHIHVGAHAGMSMSSTSFYPSVSESLLQGFQAGVSFRYAEERHVGLLAELNLTQRGWKENYDEYPFAYQRRLTYIELPVMTHIFFGSRVVKGFFNLGPQIGYMIGEKITSSFDYANAASVPGFPASHRTEQLAMKISNKFDYGITAGAGVEFTIARRNCIALEGRYYYGLGNIFPSSKKDYFSSSRGSSILVTLSYMFRIK